MIFKHSSFQMFSEFELSDFRSPLQFWNLDYSLSSIKMVYTKLGVHKTTSTSFKVRSTFVHGNRWFRLHFNFDNGALLIFLKFQVLDEWRHDYRKNLPTMLLIHFCNFSRFAKQTVPGTEVVWLWQNLQGGDFSCLRGQFPLTLNDLLYFLTSVWVRHTPNAGQNILLHIFARFWCKTE